MPEKRFKTHFSAWVIVTLLLFSALAAVLFYRAVTASDPIPAAAGLCSLAFAYFVSGFPKEIAFGEDGIRITEILRGRGVAIPYKDINSVAIYQQKKLIRPATHINIQTATGKPAVMIFSAMERAVCWQVVEEFERRIGTGKVRDKPEWMLGSKRQGRD